MVKSCSHYINAKHPLPRMLAVVRCGDQSLHETWAPKNGEFDIALSYFGDDEEKHYPGAKFFDQRKGGKWDGLAAFFRLYPDTLSHYDYFWFPDDDLIANHEDIFQLLILASRHKLDVCQPALDENSYYSHLITLRHKSFSIRFTNFVEIMAPLISSRLLTQALPRFADTRTGFGLDFILPDLAKSINQSRWHHAAIIDCVTVRHTRPVGGSLHSFIKTVPGASTSDQELSAAIQSISENRRSVINGVAVPRVRVIRGIALSGRYMSKIETMVTLLWDLLFNHKNDKQSIKVIAAVRYALKTLL